MATSNDLPNSPASHIPSSRFTDASAMQLTLQDVSRLFAVPEHTVQHWIQEENMPVEIVNSRYRCNRSELLEWATVRKLQISPEIFQQVNGDSVGSLSLADALEYGGVTHLSAGAAEPNIPAILEVALDNMPLPPRFDRSMLVQLLIARESVGSTALGDGIAIPHPRYPVVLPLPRPAIRLCFLSKPLEFDAPDRMPVDTLFVMLCPTVHEHLQLLAKLAVVLRNEGFRKVLKEKASECDVIRAARRVEESFLMAHA